MEDLFGSAVPVLLLVLPGFLATFIFYWLSDTPKPGQFERIVQALIGTAIIQFFVRYIELAALWIGKWYSFGEWNNEVLSLWSTGLAVLMGLALAYAGNNDFLYKLCRKLNLTHRSSDVSDWNFAHRTLKDRSIVLQLVDGRRLAGYPRSWPADPEKGHYLMQIPTWIVGNAYEPAIGIEFMLISATNVLWTEFLDKIEDDLDV
nr:DUF6338 family protein [uncultured Pseudomonas sp.]